MRSVAALATPLSPQIRPEWLEVSPRRRATAWPEHKTVRSLAAQELSKGAVASPEPLETSLLYRWVMGVDPGPTPMPTSEASELRDPFATTLLRVPPFPLSLDQLLAGLAGAKAVPLQAVYMISEAGQIPPGAPLQRDIRFAIVRGTAEDNADLLISTSAVGDPEAVFLQVAAWDDAAGMFNYYMRIRGTWVWAGNSYSALAEPSRGQGCFDSHVNGSVVMKELKDPWLNWQSMKSSIQLAPDDPLRGNPLYRQLSGAENLERTIRATVARWTTARMQRVLSGQVVKNLPWIMRQILTTTTVNLTSSDQESRVLVASPSEPLTLPMGFWLNADLLLNRLAMPISTGRPTAPAPLYADSLEKYDFCLVEDSFRQPGDTFFAFLVPESALEDNQVTIAALEVGLLNEHFIAAVLMVDFPNPVFSPVRASLMQYVPPSRSLASGRDISRDIATAIVDAAPGTPPGSPERQFSTNWSLTDNVWRDVFAQRIDHYLTSVAARAATAEGFDDYTRLAESRRREFRTMRLFEFTLTVPVTNIPTTARLLSMNEDGTVSAK